MENNNPSTDKPLLERTIDGAWGFLHRAGLDNCHIDLCVEDVSRILCLDESNRDEKEIRETLLVCGLPQIPLNKVMGVLFPQENSQETSTIDQLGYAP